MIAVRMSTARYSRQAAAQTPCRRPQAVAAAWPRSTGACGPLHRQQHMAAALGWRSTPQPLPSRGRHQVVAAAAAASTAAPAAAAAAQAFWPALVQAWNTNPAAVMMGAGACILGVALSIFLLASIPTMLALRRSAHAMESLLLTVAAEVPDTAATLRLSGMELADCIQEVGALSTDLTEGVRASARAVANAEAGLRQGASLAGKAVTEYVIPQAQDRLESALQERARLDYTRDMLQNTKSAVQRLRFALAAGGVARGVAQSARYLQRTRREQAGGSGGSGDELLGV